jgi:hypothetical protein
VDRYDWHTPRLQHCEHPGAAPLRRLMSDDYRDQDLPPNLRGGVILPDVPRRSRRPSLRERAKRLSTQGRTVIALVSTMLIGILALVGDSLDLWERTLGAGAWRDSVDVIYRTRGPDPPDRTVPVSPEPSSVADSPRWDDSV